MLKPKSKQKNCEVRISKYKIYVFFRPSKKMLRAFKKIETNKVFFVAAIIQTLKTEPEMVN